MERVDMLMAGPADAILAEGLLDLRPIFESFGGHVMVIGGLMSRVWLTLRPVEGLVPRATADIDLGIDRRGLALTTTRAVVGPRLRELDYAPGTGDEAFRFRKEIPSMGVLVVDLLISKGASRDPQMLERGLPTVAAPGLAYAIKRGVTSVDLGLLGAGGDLRRLEIPLPSLDAAFVLKAALAASGVRMRPDRVARDRVDALMLAAACLAEPAAIDALRTPVNAEGTAATAWLASAFAGPTSAAASTLEQHLAYEHGISGGAEWAVGVARRFVESLASPPGPVTGCSG